MTNLLLYFLFALIGGIILQKLKVPGGMMVGGALACSIANLSLNLGEIPSYIKISAQILTGVYIGINVESEELRNLKSILKPFFIVLVGLFITNIISGLLIYLIAPFSLITALLAVTPGGITNIPLIAADMGGDPAIVAIFQSARLIIGVGVFPIFIDFLAKKRSKTDENIENSSRAPEAKKLVMNMTRYLELVIIILIAALAGWFANTLGIPSAYLVLPVLLCIGAKLIRTKAGAPDLLRRIAQLLSGIYIGTCFTSKDIAQLPYLLLPLIIMIVLFIINFLICGWLINKKRYFGYTEALLASSPAGASDMALLTADLGIQNTNLNLLHVVRLLVVVIIFPYLWFLFIN